MRAQQSLETSGMYSACRSRFLYLCKGKKIYIHLKSFTLSKFHAHFYKVFGAQTKMCSGKGKLKIHRAPFHSTRYMRFNWFRRFDKTPLKEFLLFSNLIPSGSLFDLKGQRGCCSALFLPALKTLHRQSSSRLRNA